MLESTSTKGLLGFIITTFSAWATFIPVGLQIIGAVGGIVLLYNSIKHKQLERKLVQMQIEELEQKDNEEKK